MERGFRIPSDKDIAGLPKWARIAFAVSCVQQTMPAVRMFWPDVPSDTLKTLQRAIELVAHACETGVLDGAIENEPPKMGERISGRVASNIWDLPSLVGYSRPDGLTNHVGIILEECLKIAADSHGKVRPERFAQTFDSLDRLARRGGWTDTTLVPIRSIQRLVQWDLLPDWIPTPNDVVNLDHWALAAIGIREALRVYRFSQSHSDVPDLRERLSEMLEICTDPELAKSSDPARWEFAFNVPSADDDSPRVAGSVVHIARRLFVSVLAGETSELRSGLLRLLIPSMVHVGCSDINGVSYQRITRDTELRNLHARTIRHDLEIASQSSNGVGISSGFAVSKFGRLWPFGAPEGWHVSDVHSEESHTASGEQQVVLKLRIPPLEDTSENRARLRQHIKDLIKSTSGLHVAHGGSGLRAKQLRAFLPTRVGQPTGGDS